MGEATPRRENRHLTDGAKWGPPPEGISLEDLFRGANFPLTCPLVQGILHGDGPNRA
jgi:hypothetical protein